MTQQFFKGLGMALVAVMVAAFSETPIDWLLLGVTAVSAILVYFGKNLIMLWPSDSPPGALSLFNLLSGLFVAVGTGVLQSVGTYLIEGAILWPVVWKVVVSVTFTYLGTTFFAPQNSRSKVRGFVKGYNLNKKAA